ncbi:LOW QUALITY PROTEIN: taste receptor type 2 member 136-like [Acomys russatus]|uniref:LOW QUALITY PROTEIN: taste receptor type 2 member 136-like n=1 Tax=Acomys russatus TaxID=60746 RepID=UPI0021E2BFE8|nr:LOW QUALITY PROTEIN: taste receptor type 2 member 136-like [Acomys russatus]
MKSQPVTEELHSVFILLKNICSDMMSFFLSIAAIILLAEIALGSFANVFIVLVNCTDCIKGRKICLADRILTALAIFRVGFLWVILSHLCLIMFNSALSLQVNFSVCVVWALTSHFNTWLATILSIFYLLKIGNFSNLIFLRLKRKINSVVLVVFLGSLVLFFPNLKIVPICEEIQMNGHKDNLTAMTKLTYVNNLTAMMIFTLDNVLPFSTSMICFLLLIYSLCRHLRTMKLYGKGSEDLSGLAHIKALRAVISFLLLFSMFVLSLFISVYNFAKSPDDIVHVVCQVIGTLYPSSHSYILIWGNRRIKEAIVMAMRQVRERLWPVAQRP